MTAQTTQRISVMKPKKRLSFKGLFITGLIFILPLYITWILVKLVVEWLKGLLNDTFSLLFKLTLGNFLGEYYTGIEWVFLFLIGLPIVLVFILIVGWAAQNLLGKRILLWAERTVKKIPLLGGIYSATRQLVDTVFLQGKESYKRVVMVEFPRPGCWMLAFVTGESPRRTPLVMGEKAMEEGELQLNIFVPTTPNPTSGFLIFLRKSDVIPLEMSVEDGLKLVISGGILEPGAAGPALTPPPIKK